MTVGVYTYMHRGKLRSYCGVLQASSDKGERTAMHKAVKEHFPQLTSQTVIAEREEQGEINTAGMDSNRVIRIWNNKSMSLSLISKINIEEIAVMKAVCGLEELIILLYRLMAMLRQMTEQKAKEMEHNVKKKKQ